MEVQANFVVGMGALGKTFLHKAQLGGPRTVVKNGSKKPADQTGRRRPRQTSRGDGLETAWVKTEDRDARGARRTPSENRKKTLNPRLATVFRQPLPGKGYGEKKPSGSLRKGGGPGKVRSWKKKKTSQHEKKPRGPARRGGRKQFTFRAAAPAGAEG